MIDLREDTKMRDRLKQAEEHLRKMETMNAPKRILKAANRRMRELRRQVQTKGDGQ